MTNLKDDFDGVPVEDDIEIPKGFPGSAGFRKPNVLDASDIPVVKRRRGRPPGSGTSRKTSPTEVQTWVVDIVAGGYAFTAAILAMKVFNDPKYKMTPQEAKSAAQASVEVAFHYKQIRELAATVNPKSDYMIILKGFMPYLNRVFISEVVNYVLTGFIVQQPKSAGRKQSGPEPRRESHGANGTASGDGRVGGDSTDGTIPSVALAPDWRDIG